MTICTISVKGCKELPGLFEQKTQIPFNNTAYTYGPFYIVKKQGQELPLTYNEKMSPISDKWEDPDVDYGVSLTYIAEYSINLRTILFIRSIRRLTRLILPVLRIPTAVLISEYQFLFQVKTKKLRSTHEKCNRGARGPYPPQG